jgi:hypothetical protein
LSGKKFQSKSLGICKLTGIEGQYVKSHIIPQALTRPSRCGAPLVQSSKGSGGTKRWSSWYDKSMVTREGEDYLERIDTRAIRILKKHKMVWRSWNGVPPIFQSLSALLPDHSIREIQLGVEDGYSLKLFLVSILWRASVSSLPDTQDIKLSEHQENLIAAAIKGERISDSKFATALIQISTYGEYQNALPFYDAKQTPPFEDVPVREIPMYRLFVDGLIAHIHLKDEEDMDDNALYLGCADRIVVPGIRYEASFQYENGLNLMYETYLGSKSPSKP